MPINRVSIPSTFHGLSFQHHAKARPGSSKHLQNARCDVALGICKRNGTDYVASVNIPNENTYFTVFNLHYAIIIKNRFLKIINLLTGQEVPYENVVGDLEYLTCDNPKTDIICVQAQNTLVILNRTIITEFTTSDDYSVLGDVVNWGQLFEVPDDNTEVDPTKVPLGSHFSVASTNGGAIAGYYQCFTDDAGERNWRIVPPPNDPQAIPNKATLPHQIEMDAITGDFAYSQPNWRSRESGDYLSNPAPSWNGHAIDAIGVLQSRLALIGNGFWTFSEQGADNEQGRTIFRFFDYDVTASEEALYPDRIDLTISQTEIGEIFYADTFSNTLVAFGSNGLIGFAGADGNLTSVNGFDFLIDRKPLNTEIQQTSSADSLFVLDANKRINWYSRTTNGIQARAIITDHKQDIFKGETIERMYAIEDTLYIICASGKIKTHQHYIDETGNIMSAWSQLEFIRKPLFMTALDDSITIISQQNLSTSSSGSVISGDMLISTYVHRFPELTDARPFEICLDARESLVGVYNPQKNETSFQVSSRILPTETNCYIVLTDNTWVRPSRTQADRVFVNGDWSDDLSIVGFEYEFEWVTNPLWAGLSAVRPFYSACNLGVKYTTDFLFTITLEGYEAFTEEWTSTIHGFSSIGGPVPYEGIIKFPVLGATHTTNISVNSSSPGWCTFPFIEYELRVGARA